MAFQFPNLFFVDIQDEENFQLGLILIRLIFPPFGFIVL